MITHSPLAGTLIRLESAERALQAFNKGLQDLTGRITELEAAVSNLCALDQGAIRDSKPILHKLEAVETYYREGLTYKEIARLTGLSFNQIHYRVHFLVTHKDIKPRRERRKKR